MFGDSFFVSVKYGYSDAGFNLTPMDDLDFQNTPYWDATNDVWEGPNGDIGEWRLKNNRPVLQYNALGNYFNDTLFGASHDIKFGVEFADRSQRNSNGYNGNMEIDWRINSATVDFNGDGAADSPMDFAEAGEDFYHLYFWRAGYSESGPTALAAYLSDTISFGRFNILLGLRYDHQTPRINPVSRDAMDGGPAWDNVAPENVQNALNTLLPGIDIADSEILALDGSKYSWRVFSPRLGFTWDVTGDGKTIAKLSLARYGEFMGTDTFGQFPGGAEGDFDAYWWDLNSDQMMSLDEFYWRTVEDGKYTPYKIFNGNAFVGDWEDAAGVHWSGYEYDDPTNLVAPYDFIEKNTNSPITWEALLT